jgi:hypothetical protein
MKSVVALLSLAFVAAACKPKGVSPGTRAAFASCAPGADVDGCASALNGAGVICEQDLTSKDPQAPKAYRCTMEQGRWSTISILGDPVSRTRIAHLALDSSGASQDDLDQAAKAMATACGGPGTEFSMSAVSGRNWIAPGALSPADGQATVSLTQDGMTLEEAWTASRDFGTFTPWLSACETQTVQNGLM